jgi:hypothetical protein
MSYFADSILGPDARGKRPEVNRSQARILVAHARDLRITITTDEAREIITRRVTIKGACEWLDRIAAAQRRRAPR